MAIALVRDDKFEKTISVFTEEPYLAIQLYYMDDKLFELKSGLNWLVDKCEDYSQRLFEIGDIVKLLANTDFKYNSVIHTLEEAGYEIRF